MDVVVVDDVAAVRMGLVMHLECAPGLRVVGQAADGVDALAVIAAVAPDVVVMDVEMPRLDGIAATRRLREGGGTVPVVLMSLHTDGVLQGEALAAGASAFVGKCDGPGALLAALEAVTVREGDEDDG